MRAATNSAMANRQVITHLTRAVFCQQCPGWPAAGVRRVAQHLQVGGAHVTGGPRRLLVHRKGATRAFGRAPGVPAALRAVGQPVLIGGSMGTASCVLAGRARRRGARVRLRLPRRRRGDEPAPGRCASGTGATWWRSWRRAASSCAAPRCAAWPRRRPALQGRGRGGAGRRARGPRAPRGAARAAGVCEGISRDPGNAGNRIARPSSKAVFHRSVPRSCQTAANSTTCCADNLRLWTFLINTSPATPKVS